MNLLFLKFHLGLGDAILCNGMVRTLARQHEKLLVPAKFHNLNTVTWMFSDLPNVEIVGVRDDQDMIRKASGFRSLGVGIFSRRGLQSSGWDKAFYDDAGLPFECRWSKFKLPPKTDEYTPLTRNHFFIHEDRIRGYKITSLHAYAPLYGSPPYIPNPITAMRNHVPWLITANEIHVIDSCFLALADSIETKAKRHVLHLYATAHDPYKKFGPPTLRKNWEILR